MNDTLQLLAPVSGPLLPIEDVPDPVFASKMVGEGVSIDPVTSTLLAPCDAEVLSVHPSAHAVTLRARGGIELILHIGLETVSLRGEGFLPLVKNGDRVRTGAPLVAFAPDYVATHAPSLLTQMVVSSTDGAAGISPRRQGDVQAGRDVVMEVVLTGTRAAPTAAPARPAGSFITSRELVVSNPTGLHARPAAMFASAARGFASDVRLRRGRDEVNAKSVTAIMTLEIGPGDRIVIAAAGADAQPALDRLVPLVEAGLGEQPPVSRPAAATGAPAPASIPPAAVADERLFRGLGVSPGIGMGAVFIWAQQDLATPQAAGTPEEERQKLDRALAQAREHLRALCDASDRPDSAQATIFRAHLELLEDPELVDAGGELIASGTGAAAAWQGTFTRLADRLAASRNQMFAERAADVRDVGRRVLRLLAGGTTDAPAIPENSIVVAHDLPPSDTASLDRKRVRGLCTVLGGRTSHASILARSSGLAAVAGIDARVLELEPGTPAILDGDAGTLLVRPTQAERAEAEARGARGEARRQASVAAAREPAVTLDGHRVEVGANIGAVAESEQAVTLGADGVGLLRSEFLFMDRAAAPDEEEQYEAYAAVVRAFGDRPVLIRTLDVGGDKPLSYLPMAKEDNPFLGIRGIRLSRRRLDLLRTQLRAILRASAHGRVQIMFPMVATYEDWRLGRDLLEEERTTLGLKRLETGIMVEVPSAALTADVFAAEADFFSIGTNDLAQYTLAMDRGHPSLGSEVDALHPSVLRLIAQTAQAARAHGRWTGVCGAMASDEPAVPLLIGLGVDELSVSVPALPAIRARVRSLRLSECRALAERALSARNAEGVRAMLADVDVQGPRLGPDESGV
jgi:multiphosphoryl transfer protein